MPGVFLLTITGALVRIDLINVRKYHSGVLKEQNQQGKAEYTMATPIVMPKQGQTVEQCILTVWHKEVGEEVYEGDLLFSYETDKAAFDEEATIQGILLETFFEEGDEVPVLTNICVIGEEGEDTLEFRPATLEEPASAREESPTETRKISPRARRVAMEMGLDYDQASPTGAEGRIVSQDVVALEPKKAPAAQVEQTVGDYRKVELSRARKLIGERMSASASAVPRVTLNTSFNASELLDLRKKLKADPSENGLGQITLNDMVIYATSRTLLHYPELNAHLVDDHLRLFDHTHLGVACDTERGLMVPTIFDADEKSLQEIAVEAKSLIKQCRQGVISPDYLQGGTFTVTNLGPLGIESFSPLINLPQTAILGVNSIEWKIKQADGEFIHYPAMGLSLTFDHRAVDGALGARFLQALDRQLETFSLLLCR